MVNGTFLGFGLINKKEFFMKMVFILLTILSQFAFAGIQITGSVSGQSADVDTNKQLKVALPASVDNSGFSALASEYDDGSITGTRKVRKVQSLNDGHLRVGSDSQQFAESFAGAAQNTALFLAPVTTMTVVQNGGFLALNSGLSTASAAVARVQTYRSFALNAQRPLILEMGLQFAQLPQTNNVLEFGFGLATGTAAPTDGIFFRVLANGEFRGVINNNGVETQTGSVNFSTFVGSNMTKIFTIYIYDDVVVFRIDGKVAFEIDKPAAAPTLTASQSMPLLFRNYNTGVTSAAQVMRIASVSVFNGAVNTNKPWSHIMSGQGWHSSQGQTGGTMGSTALYTNSLAAGAGVAATNTTAALGSGLGGQFSVQPTLAAGTDGVISSYQVPVGTAALPAKQLCITDIKVQGAVTTLFVGGPVVYAYSLAYGHTAVSLATTETAAGTKAPRRLPLGYENYPVTAAVGTLGQGLTLNLQTPVCVQQGEFVQLVAKNLGVVTSAGVIALQVMMNGYWE
jgi:hypothetical protein